MLIKDFSDEYGRYRALGKKAMAQVPDDALNRVLAPDANSIAIIVRHVSGNLVSRFTDFLTTDGEKPGRNRDGEFSDGTFTRAEIDEAWNRGFDLVERELGHVTDRDLGRTVRIRGAELTVHQALCRSLAHAAAHVGQIVLLARMFAGADWQTLSIPKGQSETVNQKMLNEKRPSGKA